MNDHRPSALFPGIILLALSMLSMAAPARQPFDASSFGSLRDAIDALDPEDSTLLITTPLELGAPALRIPPHITLHFMPGGSLDIQDAVLTLEGSIEAGAWHIFTGEGNIVLKGKPLSTAAMVYPQWWGAQGHDALDDTRAIQAAITAIQPVVNGHQGHTLYFPPGMYLVTDTLRCEGGVTFKGAGMASSIIRSGISDGADLFVFESTTHQEIVPFIVFEDITLMGHGEASGRGLFFNNPYHVFLNRCVVYNHGGTGVEFYENPDKPAVYQVQTNIQNCFIHHNYGGGIRFGAGNNAHVMGSSINGNGKYGIYADRMNQLMILNNEFAGYFYESILPQHQATPVVLNGGNLMTIEQNAFENNGGGRDACNVRTGFNGDTLQPVRNGSLTRNLLIMSNDFKPVAADGQHLTHIRLDAATHVTIQANHFEAPPDRAGRVIGVYLGQLPRVPFIYFLNNEWGAALAPPVDKQAATTPYIWLDGHRIANTGLSTFPDGDPAPSVQGGNLFYTANTRPTVIADFSRGLAGQRVTVIVKDPHTTFDFSDSALKGNAGLDWQTQYHDHVTCVYDGELWYCETSRSTR